MDILLFSFNAIAPLLFVILLGWLIAWRERLNEKNISLLNLLCFRYLLAFRVFNGALSIDFYSEFNPRLVILGAAGIFIIMLLAWLVFFLTIRDKARRCVFIVSSFKSNNLIFALPLATNLFGESGIKAATMLIPVTIILFNFFAVVVMAYHAQQPGKGMAAAIKRTIIDIVKNPLIIGTVLGALFSILHIRLPGFLKSGANLAASAGTPVSLIVLGAQIDIKKLAVNIKPVLDACLIRLVVVPVLLIPFMILAGSRGPELGALMVVFGAPCAVTNLIMARNYGIEPDFAAQTVYLSTILSMFTIFVAISALRTLELI